MPRALVFTEYGGPEHEELADVAKPVPGPDELLVAVRAAGVNPADWKVRAGYLRKVAPVELPAVLGREVAGVVESVGADVTGFAAGDEVFGNTSLGGYSEYALMPVATAGRKPPNVTFVDASTLPVAAATAYDGVVQLDLRPDETLLIIGVAGGVGIAAAQLARTRGTRVVGTASEEKRAFVEALGVVHVAYGPGLVERLRAVAPDGVDALYDLVGGDALREVAGLVHDRARVISGGDQATVAELGGSPLQRARTAAVLDTVAAEVAAGRLRPFVTAVFPLERAAEALAVVEAGHARGKIVVEVA